MKTKLDHALALAAEGFHVFPLEAGSKLPHIDDYPNKATRDPEQIQRWWTCPVTGIQQDFNVAISTTRYLDSNALLVVDVDNKGDKHGDDTISALKASGRVLPPTRETRTPTGGRHLFYSVEAPVRQGTNVLGDGVDIRSRGGYVVAAGSDLSGGQYVVENSAPVSAAPAWLIESCEHVSSDSAPRTEAPSIAADPDRAKKRGLDYLKTAPLAVEGRGGDETTYQVACKLKDLGMDYAAACAAMSDHWNERCSPPWSYSDLSTKVKNAFRYGREAPGSAAPEVQFPPIPQKKEPHDAADPEEEHPVRKLNREFAFCLAGGGHHILWETTDDKGNQKLEHLSESAFHKRHASQTIRVGKRVRPVTEEWMMHPKRRSYDGIVFAPGEPTPDRFYNLWQGFSVKPAPPGVEHPAVKMFLDHALHNVCGGDHKLYTWLIGFFAHMVQKPYEKPLVALVFRGSKGVGKNALVERVGHLLGAHFLVTSNRRYLVGQFNVHLENCLFFVLDEAFWSGDKQAEGVLKDLITGTRHVIEPKGKEQYTVANKTRIAIVGNESWLVPASYDERRFAVFDVGEGRKQDRLYFQEMREGMERGGYAVLLQYLLSFPLVGLNFNDAPKTGGLLDQKIASLEPIEQWWLESLTDGTIVGGDFEGWPETIEATRVRHSIARYYKERQIRSRIPAAGIVGRALTICAPRVEHGRVRVNNALTYIYKLPPLNEAREDWERYIGQRLRWAE